LQFAAKSRHLLNDVLALGVGKGSTLMISVHSVNSCLLTG
jgi:hypothetical protein